MLKVYVHDGRMRYSKEKKEFIWSKEAEDEDEEREAEGEGIGQFMEMLCLPAMNDCNMIPNIVLHITQLPDIVRKSFCTSDIAMGLTFQMNYVPVVYHVCSRRN